MRRQSSPYQLFKKTLASFFGGTSHNFDAYECRYMQKIFKHFHKDYHDEIAMYPTWLRKNYKSKMDEQVYELDYEGAFRYFCSFEVIEWYLNHYAPGAK